MVAWKKKGGKVKGGSCGWGFLTRVKKGRPGHHLFFKNQRHAGWKSELKENVRGPLPKKMRMAGIWGEREFPRASDMGGTPAAL